MKKTTKKKTLTAVTGATVIGVAAAALVNGSKLETVFNPDKFEKFDNNYSSEEYDYVAGDGEETDIAGDTTKNKKESGGNDLQVLQLKKKEAGDLKNSDSFGIADNGTAYKDTSAPKNETAANGVELSQNPEQQNADRTPSQGGNTSSGTGNSGTSSANPSGNNGGNGNNGNSSGNNRVTVTPTPGGNDQPSDRIDPTATPSPTRIPDPEPTTVPEPTSTPSPAPTVEPTATPTPAPTFTPTPTPKPWEDRQLDDKDPVTTEDGQLTGLTVEFTKEEYTFGETYQEGDAKVTATFLKDGKSIQKELPYGKDGYSVTLPTVKTGRQIAVFTYKGKSARAYYTVLSKYVSLGYLATYNGEVFSSSFPGEPLKNYEEDLYNELFKYVGAPYAYASYGKTANLVETHRRYIAVLGDPDIQKEFADPALGGSYSSTVFLETGKDGYLTNMLEGFRWRVGQSLEDERSYLYYPIENWDEGTRNVLDNVVAVPDGYKIRRVAENEETVQYTADQVLEKYTGTDSTLSVPMGVTKVALNEKNTSVKTFEIPESVQEMDISSLGENLPNLQNYQVADGHTLRTDFKIVDGILYSKDGKTLLSVPAGRKNVKIPQTVTTLGKDCLKGLSQDAVITFESEKAPAVNEKTGFKGILLVPASQSDTICKSYMFRFGEECSGITFETSDGKKDLYEYNSNGPVLLYRGEDAVLAGIPQDTRGEYTVGENIKTIGENAFAGCNKLTDIVLGENIKELKKDSLLVSKHVDSITIKNPDVEITDQLFGTPGTDALNLDLKIYVPGEAYASMLESWSQVLDPVYGEGTAKAILYTKESDHYIYEDGAKYQEITSGGKTQYRLIRVYQTGKTSVQIKEGTSEIVAGAFSGCESLEIIFIPESVKEAGEEFLSECTSLETVVCGNKELFAGENYGAASTAEIFSAGDAFTDFTWDKGVVYGNTADGSTLLNVPTDYNELLEIHKGTTTLYKQALRGCELLHYIAITDDQSLREIGEECFEGCMAINGVDLENCENLKEIGERAFYNCTKLAEIILPKTLERIGNQAFYNCELLERVKAPGVQEIGDQAFYGCGSLMTTDIFTTVATLGDGAFYGCMGLTEVVLPETLGSMGESCFENCTMLKSVTVDGSITGISRYCFYGCKTLTDITFKNAGSRSGAIRVIGVQAFGNCTALETIDLSNQDFLTAMGEGTFTECQNLTTVKLPKQLTKIPDNCFNGCTSLSIVQIEAENVPQLGEKVFGDTLPAFLHIWVKEGMAEAYQNAYQPVLDPVYGEGTTASVLGVINPNQEIIKGVLFEITEEGRVLEKASTELEGEYLIPDDTVRIADNAFEGCDKLTGFDIPANATVSLGNRCFTGCSSLQTVKMLGNVPEWGDETFMGCETLEKVYLGYSSENTIKRIGTRAFKNCMNLKTDAAFEIRACVETYGEECFAGCTNLPAISTSDAARNKLQRIEAGAFRDCTSLRAFLVSKLPALTYIGDYAFANCDTLKQPAVPANVTYVGVGCFMDCDNIQYVSFYCGLEEYPKDCFKNCSKLIRTGGTAAAFNGLKRIGESAYEGCTSLTASSSWNLGRYANLEEIGDRAFYGCATLADSVLSAKMTGIGAAAFEGCSALHALWIQTETPPAFGAFSLENMAEDFCIRVPDSATSEDSIYKAYLEALTASLGKENAYKVLDSFSDGAKDRQPEDASEDQTELETGTDEAAAGTNSTENADTEEVPGTIEDVPEEPGAGENPETPSEDSGESSEDGTEDQEQPEDNTGAPEEPGTDAEKQPEQTEEETASDSDASVQEAVPEKPIEEQTSVAPQSIQLPESDTGENAAEKEKAKENER